MDVSEALRQRYSVRGDLPDPVPHELISEVFDTARLTASGTNTEGILLGSVMLVMVEERLGCIAQGSLAAAFTS